MVEPIRPNAQVRYVAKDFTTFYDALLRRVRDIYGDTYNDFASSSIGIMLIDLIAYAMAQVSWASDRQIKNNFLATATTASTVEKLAAQIGYKMRPSSASSVDLDVTFAALASAGTLPAGFQFQGPGGLVFEALADVPLSIGQTSAVVSAREGSTATLNFVGTGEPNQIYRLSNVPDGQTVADLSVRVFVDGLEWTENEFIEYETTDQFAVLYQQEPPEVIFGDGSAGNIPLIGSSIVTTHVNISGSAGNVSSGTITSAIDTLIVGGEAIALTVNNALPSSGGADSESLESVRRNAPISFASRGVAITRTDYEAQVNSFSDSQYGRVAKGTAYVVRDSTNDIQTVVLTNDIQRLTSDHADSVTAIEQSVISQAAIVSAQSAVVSENVTLIRGELSELIGNDGTSVDAVVDGGSLQSLESLAVASKSLAVSVSSNATQLLTLVGQVQTIGEDTGNNSLVSLANQMATYVNDVTNKSNSIQANSDQSSGLARQAGDSALSIASSVNANDEASVLLVSTSANIESSVSTLNGAAVALDTTVSSKREELLAYLAQLFASDCNSNLVQVPILTRDALGFYAAPSNGLIRRLQTHLDSIKEVTQLVKVVDGTGVLLAVDIRVDVKVLPTFPPAEVKSGIESLLDSVLKDRDFGEDLTLHTLHNRIEDEVSGVSYVNVKISSPAEFLDSGGNLLVPDSRILTKGTVTVLEIE